MNKESEAHHPDFYRIVKKLKDDYGIDLSHMRMEWSKHPRYVNGKRSYDFADDETVGSHGVDSVVYINPNLRPVMKRFGISGKVADLRRRAIAHELAHEIQATYSDAYNPEFEKRMTDEAKKNGFRTLYTDTVPKRIFDRELFAEYMAHLLNKGDSLDAEKKAQAVKQRPSDEDLRRMYDIVQADARLSNKVEGMGFGRNGDAYRKAAIKLRVMELARVLRDGKRIRNDIAHRPGYVPSEADAERAMRQYEEAESRIDEIMGKKAEIELGDGSIEDVRKVIASLSDEDRARIIAPGRTVYKDIPERIAGRTVAYDGGDPVGFSDIWGMYDDGRVRPSPSVTVAVSDRARGMGIAGKATRDAIRKVLSRVEEIKAERGDRSDSLRRFVWRLHKGNESSARAAAKAGFREQEFGRPHSYRQFVMSREDAERL